MTALEIKIQEIPLQVVSTSGNSGIVIKGQKENKVTNFYKVNTILKSVSVFIGIILKVEALIVNFALFGGNANV